MENGKPPRTSLTDEEETLLSDELSKLDHKLASILHDLDTDEEEFPQLVQYANDITDAKGDQKKI
jgi:hypothetical protein